MTIVNIQGRVVNPDKFSNDFFFYLGTRRVSIYCLITMNYVSLCLQIFYETTIKACLIKSDFFVENYVVFTKLRIYEKYDHKLKTNINTIKVYRQVQVIVLLNCYCLKDVNFL